MTFETFFLGTVLNWESTDFRCTNSGMVLLYPHVGLGSQRGISYLIKSKDQYKSTGKLLFACLIESLLVW